MLHLILAKRLRSYGRQILNHWTMRKVLSFLFSGIQSNHFMANRRGKSGSSDRFYFPGFQSYCNGDCNPEIKRHLLLGGKAMTNLDNVLRSRDITLMTKVCIVKAIVFPVVMYGCESWSIKKAEHQRSDAFELWFW